MSRCSSSRLPNSHSSTSVGFSSVPKIAKSASYTLYAFATYLFIWLWQSLEMLKMCLKLCFIYLGITGDCLLTDSLSDLSRRSLPEGLVRLFIISFNSFIMSRSQGPLAQGDQEINWSTSESFESEIQLWKPFSHFGRDFSHTKASTDMWISQ